jgi:hypothetical protein
VIGITNPLVSPRALLIVGLVFSIGWGIRGNYGHETGAMFPGALGGIAACLLSQRSDWHRRVIWFGFFGMLGWAFGGSISYMMVIGYTHSGQAASQFYGYVMLFVIGFLWAALGGGATALPAVLDETALRDLFRPLAVALGAWVLMYVGLDRAIAWCESHLVGAVPLDSMSRHERPLYWLDSDWLEVSIILIALLTFAMARQRFAGLGKLVGYAAVGGVALYILFWITSRTVGNGWLTSYFVQRQGDPSFPLFDEQLAVTNWPNFVLQLGQREGLLYRGEALSLWSGAILGAVVYFWRYGRFDFPLRLLLGMAIGWWIGFLLLPVLGSLLLAGHGGLRMTPPRGDNWAGVLGTLVAALVICWWHGHRPVVLAALVCGLVGGIGFSSAAWLEGVLVSQGNPALQVDPGQWTAWHQGDPVDELPPDRLADLRRWAHWQNQNWHSFLEQTYGFVNGIAVVGALAVLVKRVPPLSDSAKARSWMSDLALCFLLPVLTYVNMVKNVEQWTRDLGDGRRALPLEMQAPWLDVTLSALGWFHLAAAVATFAFLVVLLRSRRQPLAALPASWLGRGQCLLLVLMWIFVIGNFARALPDFAQERLLTEGIVYGNAVAVTALVLLMPISTVQPAAEPSATWGRRTMAAIALCAVCAMAIPSVQTWSLREIYGDAPTGKRGLNYRFGPRANWRVSPLVRGTAHR